MADHKVNVTDKSLPADQVGGAELPAVEKRAYVVTAENGLFKNGTTYENGQSVELDEATAERLIEAGEVKESE